MTPIPEWPSPLLGAHIASAALAVALGPVALGSRKGSALHIGAGRLWAVALAVAALTAIFIRQSPLPSWQGFTPIHLLIPVTLHGLWSGIAAARRGDIPAHRRAMRRTWIAACAVAGAFTLLPGRYLGDLLWHHALGWT